MKCLVHTPRYWEQNKPSRLGEYSVPDTEWNNIISILVRLNKSIGYARIRRFYIKRLNRERARQFSNYANPETSIVALKEHFVYVSYLYDQEKKRQETLDSKANQIIINVSVLFGIIAFSSSVILEGKNYMYPYSEISIISIGLSLILAFTTLVIALNVTNARRYCRPREALVFDASNFGEQQFYKQQTMEFSSCLRFNMGVNRGRSSKIIIANWLFTISVLSVFIFTFSNIMALHKKNTNGNSSKVKQIELTNSTDKDIEIFYLKF